MITVRLPRVEALFGVRSLDEITVEHLRGALNRVREREDLDFKQARYEKPRDLAQDVAAMANTQGGLIIVGMLGDEQDMAVELTPVEIGTEVLRMTGSIAGNTGPLPKFEIKVLPDPAKDGFGYLLIAVPKSHRAPHAVLVNEDLRFPRRHGPGNRNLSESEVAEAYRNRFEEAKSNVARVEQVMREGVEGLGEPEDLFLAIALAPVESGAMPLTSDSKTEIWRWFNSRGRDYIDPTGLRTGGHTGIALQRVTYSDTGPRAGEATAYFYAELHTDGAGFAAARVGTTAKDESVAATSAWFLLTACHDLLVDVLDHAVEHAMVGGDALVTAQLVVPGATRPAIKLFRAHFHGPKYFESKPATSLRESRHMVDTKALLVSGSERLIATRVLTTDLVQQLGLAAIDHVTADGVIVLSYWPEDRRGHLRMWAAKQNGAAQNR